MASNGPLAQLVEQLTLNQLVRSSSLRRVIFDLNRMGDGEWELEESEEEVGVWELVKKDLGGWYRVAISTSTPIHLKVNRQEISDFFGSPQRLTQ